VDVLVLCAAAGLAHVGVIAVDGTKMAATASSKTNRTRAQLEAEVATLFGQAAATDADEDRHFGAARGDELPAELADRARRAARLDAALAALEAQTATRRQGEQAAHQARQARVEAVRRGEPTYGRPPGGQAGVAEAEARLAHAQAADTARWEADDQRRRQAAAAGTSVRGRRPAKKSKRTRRAEKALVGARRRAAQEPPPAPPEARVNVTDPDSRTMKVAQGFIQGYNAQAAANEGGIVVAAEVSQDTGDVGLAVPMMAAVQATLAAAGVEAPVGTLLFDAGYCSAANIVAPGPDRLIATTTRAKLRRKGRATEAPPDGVGPLARMEHRLRTPEGASLYAKRGHTIEPVFGDLKDNRGFRRFIRRGLAAVSAEWKLMAMTNNILKLHRRGVVLA
jgi:hypothetical protein